MTHLSQCAYGYVFNKEGIYDKPYIFKNQPELIANFIFNHVSERIQITDSLYHPIVDVNAQGDMEGNNYLQDHVLPILDSLKNGSLKQDPMSFTEFKHERCQSDIAEEIHITM